MKKHLKYAPWGMVALAIVALFMLFAPQITTEGGNDWKGTEIVFGSTLYGEEVLKFSFMNLLTYIFVLSTIVFAILNYIKNNKNFLLVSIICAFLSAFFFFLAKNFIVPTAEIKDLIQQYCSLGVGAILGGIFSLLASGIGLAKLVLEKE